MPLYDNRFAGHLRPGDPRTPLTAAGGCVWPTFPAYRYLLCSTTGTGIFNQLRFQPIVFEKSSPGTAHDLCRWTTIEVNAPVVGGFLDKLWNPDRLKIEWALELTTDSPCGVVRWQWESPITKCNVDWDLGDAPCETGPEVGTYGTDTKLWQVEFDKTRRFESLCPPPP